MILALKIAVIIVVSGGVAFMVRYSRRTRGAAWHDPIGRTVIVPVIFAVGEVVPWGLAVFFHLSTIGNKIGAWAFIVFLMLGGVSMYWRFFAFGRHDPEKTEEKP